MPFNDLQNTKENLLLIEGIKQGKELVFNREEFLRNTTINDMSKKKNKLEYQRLFNGI